MPKQTGAPSAPAGIAPNEALSSDTATTPKDCAVEPTLIRKPGDDSAPSVITLNERYVLESELSRGAMGRVFVARDVRLGRRVAIKFLIPGTYDEDRLRRFEQEARAAGSLNHPSVLTVHDIGVHEGEPYIVSELLEGGTLRERLQGQPLAVDRAIDYALQLADGLGAAHDKGIIHRDLKPENLFITEGGRLKILDFGIAKLIAPASVDLAVNFPEGPPAGRPLKTQTGALVGTVGYMSPEQVRGQEADRRSDLFSAGAILYEMFSGRRAFEANSIVETGYAILNDEPRELPNAVPSAVAEVALHCLAKIPEERPQSAHELVRRLRSASAAAQLEAAAPPRAAPQKNAGSQLMRRRSMVGGLGILAAAATVFAVLNAL